MGIQRLEQYVGLRLESRVDLLNGSVLGIPLKNKPRDDGPELSEVLLDLGYHTCRLLSIRHRTLKGEKFNIQPIKAKQSENVYYCLRVFLIYAWHTSVPSNLIVFTTFQAK